MDDAAMRAFLDRPFVAVVGTAGHAGTPHGVPVWYRYDGARFTVWTDPSRWWVRNLGRRPEVSMVIAEHAPPFAAVLVRGAAEVTTDAPGTDDEIRRIAGRYLPAAEVEAYVAQWAALRTIVRITPTRLQAWGRGY